MRCCYPDGSAIAPLEADVVRAAYFAMTPLVWRGGGGLQLIIRSRVSPLSHHTSMYIDGLFAGEVAAKEVDERLIYIS
jgi:hypothetical protein